MMRPGSPARLVLMLVALVGLTAIPTRTAPLAQALPNFGAPTVYGFYGNVFSIASGDLNGDGNEDVVSVAWKSNGVRVGLGDGTGQLTSAGTFGTAAGPNSVALADFDGDGRLDVVTSNINSDVYNGTEFGVQFGTGTGGFAGEVSYPVGIAGQVIGRVTAGDVNGDGSPDIVTLSSRGCGANTVNCSNVTVFLNNGAGAFSQAFTRGFVSPNGYYYSGYSDVTVADSNGDGHNDLVLAIGTYDFGNEPQIQIMRGNGNGTFAITDYWRFPVVNGNPPFSTVSVRVADVTGDGWPDLVAMAQRTRPGGNSHLIVMRNDGAGGFPQASGSAHTLNWFYGGGVAIGDLNDDGQLDIAATLQNSLGVLSYLLNDGAGNFPAVTTNTVIAGAPSPILLADLNNSGPGTLDVVVGGTNGVTVFVQGTPIQRNCAVGTYSASGNEPCSSADPGYFVATEGATSQTACAVGTYSSVSGAAACQPAPAGSYVDTEAATGALLCPAGTYSATSGSASCTPADAGFFVPTIGSTSQTACPAGFWSDGGATACYVLDSDGDGVNDSDDAYPNSNMNATVSVGACTTAVVNQVLPTGATFNDLLATAAAGATSHGKLVSAVTQLSNGWKNAGLISGRDHGAITSCTARSK